MLLKARTKDPRGVGVCSARQDMLPNTSSCGHNAREAKQTKCWSLEQRKFYFKDLEEGGWHMYPKTPDSLKGFSKTFLRQSEGRASSAVARLLLAGILCSHSWPCRSGRGVPVNDQGKCFFILKAFIVIWREMKKDMATHLSILAGKSPIDRGAWRTTACRDAKNQTWLSTYSWMEVLSLESSESWEWAAL